MVPRWIGTVTGRVDPHGFPEMMPLGDLAVNRAYTNLRCPEILTMTSGDGYKMAADANKISHSNAVSVTTQCGGGEPEGTL